MRALYDASAELTELADAEKLTLSQLAEWSNDDQTIGALKGLCRLNDTRAQLFVTRYRTLAAARLFELAKDESGGEVARKACVDLLGVRLVADSIPGHAQEADAHDEPATPPVEILRMLLAEIGRDDSSPDPPPDTSEPSDAAGDCCTTACEEHG
jgi:hypothetical protein